MTGNSTAEVRRPTIGENFKFLASRLEVYNLFLQNYSKAIETVRRCSINNAKFDELSKNMKMKVNFTKAIRGNIKVVNDQPFALVCFRKNKFQL